MYDFLQFIDSKLIREYNRNTNFAPVEKAVLIARSQKKSVEEKIEALQYLIDHYTEEEFSYCYSNGSGKMEKKSAKNVVERTIQIWREVLEDRLENDGCIYTALLTEKDYPYKELYHYRFFSSYEKAYENLKAQKQNYLENEDLRQIQTYGEIERIKLDDLTGMYTDSDVYRFDNELQMVQIDGANERITKKNGDYEELIVDYKVYIPLPFKTGDIVKVESPFHETYYGVFPREWERPKDSFFIRMRISLDMYDAQEKVFYITDDSEILEMSDCTEKELPQEEQVLKLIRDVRKGKLDFFNLLWQYDDIEGLAGWGGKPSKALGWPGCRNMGLRQLYNRSKAAGLYHFVEWRYCNNVLEKYWEDAEHR